MDNEFSDFEKNKMPNNHLPLAIFSTIFGCCSFYGISFIIGIVAIVFSTQVKSKFESNDFIGAENSAKNTKMIAYISLGITIVSFIVSGVLIGMNFDEYKEIFNTALESAQQSR